MTCPHQGIKLYHINSIYSISEIGNTIKYRHLNQIRIKRTKKLCIYL